GRVCGRRDPDCAGRRNRDSTGGSRRSLPAVPRQIREGQRPRARYRPSHRQRLQRRDSRQLAAWQGDRGVRPVARAASGRYFMTTTEPNGDRRPARILVVGEEGSVGGLLAIVLGGEGYEVLLADSGRAAIDVLEHEPVDILISDIKMPDLSGVEVLRAAKKIDQDILGIMITAFASTDTAVDAMRLGACDYLSKPFDVDLLKMKVREKIENRRLRQENVLLKRTLGMSHKFSNIIGRSEAMLALFKLIETVAKTNSTILLTGESGTGKGLVAQAIHFHS